MKFAHAFEEALRSDEYPKRWTDAAISYRSLKRCIKDVQQELQGLGLDQHTIEKLLKNRAQHNLYYTFANKDNSIEPRLVFKFEEHSGIPLSASLSSRTRKSLQAALGQQGPHDDSSHDENPDGVTDNDMATMKDHMSKHEALSAVRCVEIPMTTDSKFFRLLAFELAQLSDIQADEESKLKAEAMKLGATIADATESGKSGKSELYAWRDVFSLYIECQVFFSTNERENKFERNSTTAQQQLQKFSDSLRGLSRRFKKQESNKVLQRFVDMNMTLLRNLRFQELNVLAMTKILKKFDKSTALRAKETFPELVIAESFSSFTLSKSVCFEIAEKLLSVVPLLDDYLCPICFNISFKPIRLKCNHIFCIRCLIVLQRTRQNVCPLCRDSSAVMEADSENLDSDMMAFLKRYFPDEVKLKQKQNEREAAKDIYGPAYDQKCHLM